METYIAKLDENPLEITLKISSDALLDGFNKVLITIYNEAEPRKWRKIEVTKSNSNIFNAEIVKKRLVKRPVLKMRVNFIVDDVNLKTQIAKKTSIAYNLKSINDTEKYESKYDDGFDLGSTNDETFSVTKRIEIIFK